MDRFLRASFDKLSQIEYHPINIVLGNESADLDSVVCSITTAFLFESLNNEPYVPILNLMSFDDIKLRGEVVYWLSYHNLCENSSPYGVIRFPCIDESIDLLLQHSHQHLHDVILVDHQPSSGSPNIKQIYDKVTHVYDHHALVPTTTSSSSNKEMKHQVIEMIGSCASIVAREYKKNFDKIFVGDERKRSVISALKLLYGAIILDTECLASNNNKTTKADVEMIQWIEKVVNDNLGKMRKSIYKSLIDKKNDVSGFTVWQLLRRDMKYIYYKERPLIAIPSILGVDINDFTSKDNFREDFQRELNNFSSPLICIVANVVGSSGHFLLLYNNNKVKNQSVEIVEKLLNYLLNDFVAQKKLSSTLVSPTNGEYSLIKVKKPHVNRKMILPLIETFVTENNNLFDMADTSCSNSSSTLPPSFAPPPPLTVYSKTQIISDSVADDFHTANGIDSIEFESSPRLLTPNNSDDDDEEEEEDHREITILYTDYDEDHEYSTATLNSVEKKDRSLPTLNNKEMIEKVLLKRNEMQKNRDSSPCAADTIIPRNKEFTFLEKGDGSFTPHNSFTEDRETILHGMKKAFTTENQSEEKFKKIEKKVLKKRQHLPGDPNFGSLGDTPSDVCIHEEVSEESSSVTNLSSSCNSRRLVYPSQPIDLEIHDPIRPSSCTSVFEELEKLESSRYEVLHNPQDLVNAMAKEHENNKAIQNNSQLSTNSKRMSFRAQPPHEVSTDNFLKDCSFKDIERETTTCAFTSPAASSCDTILDASLHEEEEDSITNATISPQPTETSATVIPPSSSSSSSCTLSSRQQSIKKIITNGIEECIYPDLIKPYLNILTHGGYYENPQANSERTEILLFNACHMPSCQVANYEAIIDSLFRFIVHVMENQIMGSYCIVYFYCGYLPQQNPRLRLIRRFYTHLSLSSHAQRIKKNLKNVYLVHPTFWLKTALYFGHRFFDDGFYEKITYIYSLRELAQVLPTEFIQVPREVISFDRSKRAAVV